MSFVYSEEIKERGDREGPRSPFATVLLPGYRTPYLEFFLPVFLVAVLE